MQVVIKLVILANIGVEGLGCCSLILSYIDAGLRYVPGSLEDLSMG